MVAPDLPAPLLLPHRLKELRLALPLLLGSPLRSLGTAAFFSLLFRLGLGFQAEGAAHRRPVCPKPPSPRSVEGNASVSSHSTRVTGATTNCAMRSPRRMMN